MDNQGKNTEVLTDDEIDKISNDLGYPEETNPINSSNPSIIESELSKSTSQNIYNNDSLTDGLKVISFQELLNKEYPSNRWLVDRLIPFNGISCISGKPKVGKSIFSLYLAICIASGIKFLDEFEVQQGGVLLISKEDPEWLIQERIKALTGQTDLPIKFLTGPQLFLDSDKYIDQIISIIEKNHLKVIIIDSFRRIFKGEENSSQVIAQVQNTFKILLEKGITLIFIHHHGKEGFFKRDAGDQLRGSSDILAILDSLLMVERKDEVRLKVTQIALRVAKPIQPFMVQFPDLDGGSSTFKFLGHIEEDKEKIELAKEDISALLQQERYNQTTIIKHLTSNGKHKATTIKNAIKDLYESKRIGCITQGKEKVYFLSDPDNDESISQPYIKSDLLTNPQKLPNDPDKQLAIAKSVFGKGTGWAENE